MPELPDVETFRRYLNATALHQRIERIRVRHTGVLEGISARRLQRALHGRAFDATGRHGKYMFVTTDQAPWLVLHFGMTGFLMYEKDRDPGDHDRMLIDFDNGYSLAYVCSRLLGKVTLADSPEGFVQGTELGPDAMAITAEQFFSGLKNSRAAIKSCLMNQQRLAGVGNVYSDEILFQSRLSPTLEGKKLAQAPLDRLYRQMQRVLGMAVDRQADPAKLPSSWLLPHRQEGEVCPRCSDTIQKMKISGRSAYWCPHCQKT